MPSFVWLFRDDATVAKGPGYDEGTNLRLRDFAVVPLMPTRVIHIYINSTCEGFHVTDEHLRAIFLFTYPA